MEHEGSKTRAPKRLVFNVAKFFEKDGKKDEANRWYSRAEACLRLI